MRHHLSYANVVATLALVFAMSGTGLAAKHYFINSTKQINPKVLKALKGNNGVTGTAGKEGAPGKEGPQGKEGKEGAPGKEGKEGPQGKLGTTGATGPIGPSNVYEERNDSFGFGSKTLTLKVPAGSYAIVAKVLISNGTATVPASVCILEPSDGFSDFTVAFPPQGAEASLSNVATDTFSGESTITYKCSGGGPSVGYYQMRMVATQVGSVH
jgi:hypothetical protein